MENQVQRLLASEKEVNKQVQAALEQKRKKLSTIQEQAEIAVSAFKQSLEEEMTAKVAQVSSSRPLTTRIQFAVNLISVSFLRNEH